MTSKLAILGGTPVRQEPWPHWPNHGPDVIAAINRVAHSRDYHPQFGGETAAFEQEFAAYHGVPHAVGTAHGTLALQVAMAAAGIGCGDEVIVPAYTYVASASAAVAQHAIPVLVDSEPLSQGLDPADVRRKLTPRTKAIVVVHCNGYPCDMDTILQIARERHLIVVEDCSHAHGAEYKGRKVGTLGHFGAFSLQQKKNLSAGCGGIVITRDADMAAKMRDWRTFNWSSVGNNWQMSEFHAAIGRAVLPHLDAFNQRRRENVATLLEALGPVKELQPLPGLPDTEPGYYNLILQYDRSAFPAPRRAFVAALQAEGIPMHMFYVPLQRWPIFAKADYFGHGCPFTCPMNMNGPRPVDYSQVSTPVADAICDHLNLEVKVQPSNGPREMKQAAEALLKILHHREALVEVEALLRK